MKWNLILRSGKRALLQSASDTQFAVVSGYNPDAPEDQQWDHGSYFPYWEDTNKKVQMLSNALEYFRCLTEENYIPRERLIELATRFKDCETGDEDLDNVLDDMEENEVDFFCLEGRVLRDDEL